jgi:UDP-N-acetylglucosamine:LPS N-acetylglucosamine transferase
LTNRILGKWATAIATGAPLEHYNYPIEKSRYVGIPIAAEYHEFSKSEQTAAKRKWGIAVDKPLVVVTGGGLGASRINDAIVLTLEKLLKLSSVVLISGEGQYDDLRSINPQITKTFSCIHLSLMILHRFLELLIWLLPGPVQPQYLNLHHCETDNLNS